MVAKVKSVGAFLISRPGLAVLRDVGYAAIGAGLMTAGIVGLRDFTPGDGFLASLIQSSPLIAMAAGAAWAMVKA